MGTILNGKENIFIWGGGLLIYWEEKKFSKQVEHLYSELSHIIAEKKKVPQKKI
jgi:hypothetical protein